MYSTHIEEKWVIPERFTKILKAKIYKNISDSKYYLSFLNKLVDQYNNTFHHFINKKPINANYWALNERIETNLKVPKFKVNDRVRIT